MPLLALVAVTAQQPPAKLTLDEAVKIGSTNAFSVRQAQNRLDKATYSEKASYKALGPSISLGGNYTYQKLEFESSNTGSSPGAFGFDGTNKSVSATLTQPIDISGLIHLAATVLAEQRKVATHALSVEENNIRSVVKAKFLNVLQASELIDVQSATLKANQERLEKGQVKFREGAVSKFEVLRLETEVKKSEQALIEARANLKLAKQDLNNTLGRPVEEDFEPVPVTGIPNDIPEVQTIVRQALLNRPEIKQATENVVALDATKKLTWRSMRPSLNLSVSQTHYIQPAVGSTKGQTIASLNLTVPVYDSGQTRLNVEAAQRDVDFAEISLEQIKLGVSLEAQTAYTNARTALDAIAVAKANVTLSEEALRLAQLRYDQQVGILLDVTTAQTDLTAARASLVVANYKYLQAYAALQKAVGNDNLEPNPPVQENLK
ncbi:MAG: TolC family protein [Fimbriimonadaceae bacterium]|nr:TolC family protein [Fimbriimonadaceae bacterium]